MVNLGSTGSNHTMVTDNERMNFTCSHGTNKISLNALSILTNEYDVVLEDHLAQRIYVVNSTLIKKVHEPVEWFNETNNYEVGENYICRSIFEPFKATPIKNPARCNDFSADFYAWFSLEIFKEQNWCAYKLPQILCQWYSRIISGHSKKQTLSKKISDEPFLKKYFPEIGHFLIIGHLSYEARVYIETFQPLRKN